MNSRQIHTTPQICPTVLVEFGQEGHPVIKCAPIIFISNPGEGMYIFYIGLHNSLLLTNQMFTVICVVGHCCVYMGDTMYSTKNSPTQNRHINERGIPYQRNQNCKL